MIYCIGHNIISPLGFTSEANYEAVVNGHSALRLHEGTFDLPEPFFGSVIDDDSLENAIAPYLKNNIIPLTKIEKMLILSVIKANDNANIDLCDKRTAFVISTTKGNVSYLSENNNDDKIFLWHTAEMVCRFFGNCNEPLVISNACISGAAAQMEALRLIENGIYDNVVVTGADVLSKFIISGFQSFKALSSERCQPFDRDRKGLNLGEASATMIFSAKKTPTATTALRKASVRNDARHISAPSIEAEGLYNALSDITEDIDINDISFINAHGTATIYNDEMEALALNRTGMQHIPVNSLKAYFGHTLGAAGIVESILSAMALDKGTILKSEGCINTGAKHEIHPVLTTIQCSKRYFIKMISGFGGSNAALLFENVRDKDNQPVIKNCRCQNLRIISTGILSDNKLIINDKEIHIENLASNIPDSIYRSMKISYPKYFKMDMLSKVGFIVSELMLRDAGFDIETKKKEMAIALFNSSASSDDDIAYLESIKDKDSYYPSPSIFVYTLPNIVAGEIAIRNKILGETSFFISKNYNPQMIYQQVCNIMSKPSTKYILCGWCEYFKGHYDVRLMIVTKDSEKGILFNTNNIL